MRGIGGVYKRGGIWWIRYSANGKRVRESANTTRRRDAEGLLKQRIAEIQGGEWVAKTQRLDFAGLIDLVRADYRLNARRAPELVERAARRLEPTFGHLKAHQIAADILDRHATSRLEAGAAPSTVRGELAVLRRGYSLALRKGLVATVPPFPTIRIDNARVEFIEESDLEALRRELPDYVLALVEFAFLTGWRVKSEIIGRGHAKEPLRWSDVDWETGIVRKRIRTTKNNDGREYPFASDPRLVTLLQRQLAYTRKWEKKLGAVIPWVFHRKGVQLKSPPYRAWQSACRRAGVLGADGRPKVFHDCRRSQVRNLDRSGVSRDVAKRLVGHKTDAMYSRYNIIVESDLRDGVAKLARAQTEPTTPVTPLATRAGA